LQLYGQPFAPHPNVPYWDNRTATLINNNPTDLGMSLNLAVCFPAQGGIGRPFGQPYWSTGGYMINNGADDSTMKAFAANNPRPGTVLADGSTEPGVIVNNGNGITMQDQINA